MPKLSAALNLTLRWFVSRRDRDLSHTLALAWLEHVRNPPSRFEFLRLNRATQVSCGNNTSIKVVLGMAICIWRLGHIVH